MRHDSETMCNVCGHKLALHSPRVYVPMSIADQSDPLWRHRGTAIHRHCFEDWALRERVIAHYSALRTEAEPPEGPHLTRRPDGVAVERWHFSSPKCTYTALLEQWDPVVHWKLIQNDTLEELLSGSIDGRQVYIDELGITEIVFTPDERYLIVCNFYYNPIEVWDLCMRTIHLEIDDLEDVYSIEPGLDNVLTITDGEGRTTKWDLSSRSRLQG